jgi:hypothetical protein
MNNTNTYSYLLTTYKNHKLYLAQVPPETENKGFTLHNSIRYMETKQSVVHCFKDFVNFQHKNIPESARFFVYLRFYDTYDIWSEDFS